MNHSEEWQTVEEILQEECSQVKYSPIGICPCCGCEVVELQTFRDEELDIDGITQVCECCDWESVVLYDA